MKAPRAQSSVQLKAKTSDLRLEVDGVGPVDLPVSAAQAHRLCRVGKPAQFGRGEETLTDSAVRDTWEIPKDLVRLEWSDKFETLLETVRDQLGLSSSCELTADFHSMLVYEPGQFFVAHQDSEKDDAMIGTLVVTVPSAHTGGELVLDDGGKTRTYRGSKTALSLVAFYSDCRHEVLPVRSGHRITLTYNLLLSGVASEPITGDDASVGDLARCLDQHFTTRVTRPYSGTDEDPPIRLVYLLDHEYTARGLSWSRLKGADAGRASLLRAAASRSGCEVVLALADIQETWTAYDEPEYGHPYWDDDADDDSGGEDHSGEYVLGELIESVFQLTRWTDPDGTWSEDISLTVDDAEVCATTRSADLQPYTSEYEGYMGNYGNTMDRWYRRAALVVWPRDRRFANRAEAAPAWALDELDAHVRAGDLAGARAAAATLAPFWDGAVRTQGQTALVGRAIGAAAALDDAELAGMLLRSFRIEGLTPAHSAPLASLALRYGEQWMGHLLQMWFGDRQTWAYAVGQDRSDWLASLPVLCGALQAVGKPGTVTARRLLDLSWDWLRRTIRGALADSSPSRREKSLADLGQPLAAVLAAAAATGASSLRDNVIGIGSQHGDEVIACVMPALRAAVTLPADTKRDGGFDVLAVRCAGWLQARLARAPRADDDWSIGLPDGCTCELCSTLGAFLRDPAQRTFEWPLAQQRRQHVHSRIDAAELPVRHVTRRSGRPYTLVLTKSQRLFEIEEDARVRDETDLEWLAAEWSLGTVA